MGKRKVAIVSFFKSENYGAILQCVGLQRVLQNNGIETSYLDYVKKSRLSIPRRIIHTGYILVRLLFGYKKRAERTATFRKNHLVYSTFISENEYDLYIVGSDQVWMPDYVSDFFLLNFVQSSNKISYASSFGITELPESCRQYYFNALSSFNAISTRESSGLKILDSLGLAGGKQVLDPTLLISKKEWLSMAVLPKIDYNYILCYIMNGDEFMARYAHKVAKRLRDKVGQEYKILTIGDKEYKSILPGVNLINDAGPAEFMGYIYKADYVITSSFHGTCFSILFNKNYVNILRPDNPVNCRIEDLVCKMGLEDRVFYTNSQDVSPLFNPINYANVESRLSKYRDESLEFLLGTVEKLSKKDV